MTITTINATYGSKAPQQTLTLTRDTSTNAPTRTVIFVHGGGWRSGDLSVYEPLVTEWATYGWCVVNMNYRVGVLNGSGDDGKLMLEDVGIVLNKFRVKPYVDPDRIIFYGSSSGGHLAAWAATVRGADVLGAVLLSPTCSIPGAIAGGLRAGADSATVRLGHSASEFFNYSIDTDPSVNVATARNAYIAVSLDEWVDHRVHGRALAYALGPKCVYREVPGTDHGLGVALNHPEIRAESLAWADALTS